MRARKDNREIDTISIYDLPIKECYLRRSVVNKEDLKKKKKDKKYEKIILFLCFLIFLGIGSYNIIKLINWNNDNKKTLNTIKDIEDNVVIVEVEDDENVENVNEPDDDKSDYWYYVSFPLMNVNFRELIQKNSDTVGWINVNNTNINYPMVQTSNNDYYLNHSYDKSVNEAGWVFLDFRNDNAFSDRNTIIYAHSRLDKTMFGSLSKVLKSSWYTDKSNHIIRISTPSEDTLWQIFSVYVIKEEAYYITVDFSDNDSYMDFLNTVKSRSKYNFNTELSSSDRIITLSTCYSDTERTVVHAKLIKRSAR